MGRIKIEDLPKDKKISAEELKKVMGGTLHLQMMMDKKDQVEKTFSNILMVFQNTQRDLVANLK